jgi:hypothetical protein
MRTVLAVEVEMNRQAVFWNPTGNPRAVACLRGSDGGGRMGGGAVAWCLITPNYQPLRNNLWVGGAALRGNDAHAGAPQGEIEKWVIRHPCQITTSPGRARQYFQHEPGKHVVWTILNLTNSRRITNGKWRRSPVKYRAARHHAVH